ncbi:DUF4249 family protein [Prolixibacteraceae bacterium]|nr:DUF4249 family protein [Prolixibacteraceae bacterium]
MKKTAFYLFLISLVATSCHKDVTNEYVKDNITYPLVECVLSPNEPIKLYLTNTLNFNQPLYFQRKIPVQSILIIEDGIKEIDLDYNDELNCYYNKSTPKAGSHYCMKIKIKNKPLITSECTVPSMPVLEDITLQPGKQSYRQDENEKMDAFKLSFKLKPEDDIKKYGIQVLSYLASKKFGYISFDENTIERLQKHEEPQIFIDHLKGLIKRGESEIKYQYLDLIRNNREQFIPRIKAKYSPEELSGRDFIFAYLKSIEDIIDLHYYQYYDDDKRETRSSDAIFDLSQVDDNGLLGNLKYYNQQELSIYTKYYPPEFEIGKEITDVNWLIFRHEVSLEVSYLSHSLYEYKKGIRKQFESQEEVFSPLVPLQGNVKNALGVFGAASTNNVFAFGFR